MTSKITKFLAVLFSILFITVLIGVVVAPKPRMPPNPPNKKKPYAYGYSGGGTLFIGWNLVSMPVDISKTSVTIYYNNNAYTWAQAVSQNLIYKDIYTYTGSNYAIVDNFEVYTGRWMYVIVNGVSLAPQIIQYTLTVSVNPSGSGTVTLNPPGGIYNNGTVVILQATANTGYVFSGWSGDLTGNTNPVSITMNSNKVVTANFNQQAPGNIVYCKAINIDPSYTEVLICDKLVISNQYTNIIYCKQLKVGEVVYL